MLKGLPHIESSTYLSIYIICIAPLQGNCILRSAPSPGPGKKEGLKETIKRARKITWKRAQFERKVIPDRGTSRREGPILFSGRVRTWYQIVTTRDLFNDGKSSVHWIMEIVFCWKLKLLKPTIRCMVS